MNHLTTDLGDLATPHQATSYKYNIKGEMVEVTQGVDKKGIFDLYEKALIGTRKILIHRNSCDSVSSIIERKVIY